MIGLVWIASQFPGYPRLSAPRDCWTSFLLYLVVGFVIGAVVMASLGGGYPVLGFRDFYSRLLGGRAFSPRHRREPLPLLPKAILIALLSSAIPLVHSYENCPGFVDQHFFFLFVWLMCGASIVAWLTNAFAFQQRAEAARTAEIEEFLSGPSSPVPPPTGKPPWTMILWHYLNIVLFAIVILIAVFSTYSGI